MELFEEDEPVYAEFEGNGEHMTEKDMLEI